MGSDEIPLRIAVGPHGHSSTNRRKSAPSGRPLRGEFCIISGGQTGADRAVLDVALKLKIPCGGWCPGDRAAEDGRIADRYPLTALPNAGYRERTRQNVIDRDGTVILSFGSLTGGSKATAGDCGRFKKPCLAIDASITTASEAAILIAVFLLRHRIHMLNVAGPRASGQPRIYAFVVDVLMHLLATRRKKKPRMARMHTNKKMH
jgi:Circularly permutated YpsA SLOG family